MNVEKKIAKYKKRFEKACPGDTVKVIKFKRKHFKDDLSTDIGFGYQDLKDSAREFYKWMVVEDLDIKVEPIFDEEEAEGDFGVLVTTVKPGCPCPDDGDDDDDEDDD